MRALRIIGLIAIAAAGIAAGSEAAGDHVASTWRMPHVVRLHTGEVYSYFPAYAMSISSALPGEPQGLLLRDGDLVAGESTAFVYHGADGDDLTTGGRSGIVLLAGQPVALAVAEIGARGWLDRATTAELAELRLVGFEDSIPAGLWPATRRLAAANPGVALTMESWENAPALLALFRPTMLLVGERGRQPPGLFAEQQQIETLAIRGRDSGAFEGFARLPHLKRLFLSEWDPSVTGPLPAGMTELRSLVILPSEGDSSLASLRNVSPALEELSILAAKGIADIGGVAAFPELRTLMLNGSERVTDLRPLATLTRLQWLGLPPKTTQQQFDAIVRSHPDLRIIDLTDVDSVGDLTALKELKGLEALTLSTSPLDMRVLPQLKSLRFVGVRSRGKDSAWVDSTRALVAKVRQALPDALVVPVHPLCLGSGWILLLIPAAALSWYGAARARTQPIAPAVSG